MTATTEHLLRIKSHEVAWREIADELVILHMGTASYLTLNASARILWNCLLEGATQSQLVGVLTERYGIDAAWAERDVEAFLQGLVDCRLLTRPA